MKRIHILCACAGVRVCVSVSVNKNLNIKFRNCVTKDYNRPKTPILIVQYGVKIYWTKRSNELPWEKWAWRLLQCSSIPNRISDELILN